MSKYTKDNLICFWKTNEKYGCLSNWYLSNFTVDNKTFHSGEQWFMYQKALLFKDEEIADKIINITLKIPGDNAKIKALGRKVKNFEEKIWNERCEDIVYNGLLEKFRQNQGLKAILLSTEDKYIVEASPVDNIWGIGLAEGPETYDSSNWKGQNRLGNVLMRVRNELKKKI